MQSGKSEGSKEAGTLYSHLTETLKRMYRAQDKKTPAEEIEKQSLILKAVGFDYVDLADEDEVKKREHGKPASDAKLLEERVCRLLKVVLCTYQDKGSEIIKNIDKCDIQDIVSENEYWRRAGLGLSDEEALYLQKAMEKLAGGGKNIKRIKFFGMFQGLKKDYFVIEGNSLKNYKEHLPEDYEPRGNGANSYTYWASTERILSLK